MNYLFDRRGLTLTEVIVTLAVLGAVICPLMNFLVLSQKINSEGEKEYRCIQTAQYYMEETRAAGGIDAGVFTYNSGEMCYERNIFDALDDCIIRIRVRLGSYGLQYIVVDILSGGEVINSLAGSVVY